MKNKSVTAVIPTKNRPHDLLNAVCSIYQQEVLPDCLLIIDQSESDDSKKKILEYVSTTSIKIKLEYIHDSKILGLVPARSKAVEINVNDIVMFFEDDVILNTDYVQKMLNGFSDIPSMMGASGIMTNYKPSLFYKIVFHLFHRGIFFDKRLSFQGKLVSSPKYVQSMFMNGGVSAYRKEVLESVPFDILNDFFMYEDVEYSVRACRQFGENNFYINTQARLQHLFSPINRNKLRPFYERKARESICYYKKNREDSLFGFDITWLFFGFTIEAVHKAFKNMTLEPLIGLIIGAKMGILYKIVEVK
jgi:GT2 family glycosyltransferase